MPKRKRNVAYIKRNHKRRRVVRRKRGSILAVTRVPRGVTGMSNLLSVKLKWCAAQNKTPAAGTWETKQIRGNSIFECDYTLSTGQPRYHDQYAAMFQHYRVHACKIHIRVMSRNGTDLGKMYLIARDAPGIPSTERDFCEQPGVKRAFIGNDKSQASLTMYRTTQSLIGKNRATDTTTQAIFLGNPTESWVYTFGYLNANLVTAADLNIEYTATYYCRFAGRITPGVS